MADESAYYIADGERTIGPLSEERVLQAIRAGKVNASTNVCVVGGSEWRPLGEVVPFAAAFAPGTDDSPARRDAGAPPLASTAVEVNASASRTPPKSIAPGPALLVVAVASIVIGASVYWFALVGPSADLPGTGVTPSDAPDAGSVVEPEVASPPFRSLMWGMSVEETARALGVPEVPARVIPVHATRIAWPVPRGTPREEIGLRALEVRDGECVRARLDPSARDLEVQLTLERADSIGSFFGTADSAGRITVTGCGGTASYGGEMVHSYLEVLWNRGLAEVGTEADVELTVETLPGEPWTCGDPGYAFMGRHDEDARRICPIGPLTEPIGVMAIRGDVISRTPPEAWSGACHRYREMRDGECVWAEEIQLLFWRGRLYGITFLPFGTFFHRPDDVATDAASITAALDLRFGTGRDTSSDEGNCRTPEALPAGFIRRCRRWETPETMIEMYARAYGGDIEHAVHYESTAVRAEIDATLRAAADAAAAAAAASEAAAVEAAGSRL